MKSLIINEPKTLEQKATQLAELEVMQKEIKARIALYKTELLEYMQEKKVLSLKLETYTLTRAKRFTPQVIDYELLKKSLEKENIPYMLKEVFADQMSVVFKQVIAEGKELDGLEALETEYVVCRVKDTEKENV